MSDEENSPDYLETDMTSTEYEILTQGIYQAIINDEGNDNINVQHNVTVDGKSGAKHQIDVLWEHKIAGKTYKTFIECKHYKRAVSIGHIRNFFGVLQDTDATGIFVTKVGYQSGAQTFAKFYNIDTKVIKKTEDDDLEGRIRKIFLQIHLVTVAQSPPPIVGLELTGLDSTGTSLSQEFIDDLNKLTKDEDKAVKVLGSQAHFCDASEKFDSENIGQILPKLLPVLEKGVGGPYQEKIELTDKFLKVKDKLVGVKALNVQYHVQEAVSATETNDAIDIYSHILKDFESGEIEFLKKKD